MEEVVEESELAGGPVGRRASGVAGGGVPVASGSGPERDVCSRRNTILGYMAGIVTGVTYGLNPLFAKPLLEMGVSVDTMLSIRYLLAVVILGIWLVARKESLRVNAAQAARLVLLGLLFALSSATLFVSYNYIPAGLATTIVFLYPVLVALIMVFLKVYPTWQVWLSIFLTFAGVVILSLPSSGVSFNAVGLLLAGASALVYAMYLVIVNRSRRLRTVSNHVLTFYALLFGSFLFVGHGLVSGGNMLDGIHGWLCWLCLAGLAIFPTLMSLLCLAISTRLIGATRTSVLGVTEPVTAIAVGCIFFNESLTLNVIVGVAITLFAVTFMALTDRRR
ncbi:MAG: DMT family transporter [Candidatus Cryptobacteroides sp.]